jgi:carbonic anhydrase
MLPDVLIDGYRRFRDGRLEDEKARYRALADGQTPQTMIVACADSRVDPATIFAAAPGELFVVRNVAALVPPYEPDAGYHGTSAALEFAVTGLRVRNIVVMGHGQCGGVTAALAGAERKPAGMFIGPWVELLAPARDPMLADDSIDPEDRQQILERRGIRLSMENLRTFPFVQAAENFGEIDLFGAWFSIRESKLYWCEGPDGAFAPVST